MLKFIPLFLPLGATDGWMYNPEITLPATSDFSLCWNAVTYDEFYRDLITMTLTTYSIQCDTRKHIKNTKITVN